MPTGEEDIETVAAGIVTALRAMIEDRQRAVVLEVERRPVSIAASSPPSSPVWHDAEKGASHRSMTVHSSLNFHEYRLRARWNAVSPPA